MGLGTRRWYVGRVRCFFTVDDGNTDCMPKVNPETGEPMSDAPDGPPDTRGGMEAGDPGLDGATEVGRSGVGYKDTGESVDDNSTQLPAQKGGAAGGGGQAGG
jgi:hypothetical protein